MVSNKQSLVHGPLRAPVLQAYRPAARVRPIAGMDRLRYSTGKVFAAWDCDDRVVMAMMTRRAREACSSSPYWRLDETRPTGPVTESWSVLASRVRGE